MLSFDAWGFPNRPGQDECQQYVRWGWCSFGGACRFDHRRGESLQGFQEGFLVQKIETDEEGAVKFDFWLETRNERTPNHEFPIPDGSWPQAYSLPDPRLDASRPRHEGRLFFQWVSRVDPESEGSEDASQLPFTSGPVESFPVPHNSWQCRFCAGECEMYRRQRDEKELCLLINVKRRDLNQLPARRAVLFQRNGQTVAGVAVSENKTVILEEHVSHSFIRDGVPVPAQLQIRQAPGMKLSWCAVLMPPEASELINDIEMNGDAQYISEMQGAQPSPSSGPFKAWRQLEKELTEIERDLRRLNRWEKLAIAALQPRSSAAFEDFLQNVFLDAMIRLVYKLAKPCPETFCAAPPLLVSLEDVQSCLLRLLKREGQLRKEVQEKAKVDDFKALIEHEPDRAFAHLCSWVSGRFSVHKTCRACNKPVLFCPLCLETACCDRPCSKTLKPHGQTAKDILIKSFVEVKGELRQLNSDHLRYLRQEGGRLVDFLKAAPTTPANGSLKQYIGAESEEKATKCLPNWVRGAKCSKCLKRKEFGLCSSCQENMSLQVCEECGGSCSLVCPLCSAFFCPCKDSTCCFTGQIHPPSFERLLDFAVKLCRGSGDSDVDSFLLFLQSSRCTVPVLNQIASQDGPTAKKLAGIWHWMIGRGEATGELGCPFCGQRFHAHDDSTCAFNRSRHPRSADELWIWSFRLLEMQRAGGAWVQERMFKMLSDVGPQLCTQHDLGKLLCKLREGQSPLLGGDEMRRFVRSFDNKVAEFQAAEARYNAHQEADSQEKTKDANKKKIAEESLKTAAHELAACLLTWMNGNVGDDGKHFLRCPMCGEAFCTEVPGTCPHGDSHPDNIDQLWDWALQKCGAEASKARWTRGGTLAKALHEFSKQQTTIKKISNNMRAKREAEAMGQKLRSHALASFLMWLGDGESQPLCCPFCRDQFADGHCCGMQGDRHPSPLAELFKWVLSSHMVSRAPAEKAFDKWLQAWDRFLDADEQIEQHMKEILSKSFISMYQEEELDKDVSLAKRARLDNPGFQGVKTLLTLKTTIRNSWVHGHADTVTQSFPTAPQVARQLLGLDHASSSSETLEGFWDMHVLLPDGPVEDVKESTRNRLRQNWQKDPPRGFKFKVRSKHICLTRRDERRFRQPCRSCERRTWQTCWEVHGAPVNKPMCTSTAWYCQSCCWLRFNAHFCWPDELASKPHTWRATELCCERTGMYWYGHQIAHWDEEPAISRWEQFRGRFDGGRKEWVQLHKHVDFPQAGPRCAFCVFQCLHHILGGTAGSCCMLAPTWISIIPCRAANWRSRDTVQRQTWQTYGVMCTRASSMPSDWPKSRAGSSLQTCP